MGRFGLVGSGIALALAASSMLGCPTEPDQPDELPSVEYTGSVVADGAPVEGVVAYVGDQSDTTGVDGTWSINASGERLQVDVGLPSRVVSYLDCETEHDVVFSNRGWGYRAIDIILLVSGLSDPDALRGAVAIDTPWGVQTEVLGPELVTDDDGGVVTLEIERVPPSANILVFVGELESGALTRHAIQEVQATSDEPLEVELALMQGEYRESTLDGGAPQGVATLSLHQEVRLSNDASALVPVFEVSPDGSPSVVHTLEEGTDAFELHALWDSRSDCGMPETTVVVDPQGDWRLPSLPDPPGVAATSGTWTNEPDLQLRIPDASRQVTVTTRALGQFGTYGRTWYSDITPGCGDELRWPVEMAAMEEEYGGRITIEAEYDDGNAACEQLINLDGR